MSQQEQKWISLVFSIAIYLLLGFIVVLFDNTTYKKKAKPVVVVSISCFWPLFLLFIFIKSALFALKNGVKE